MDPPPSQGGPDLTSYLSRLKLNEQIENRGHKASEHRSSTVASTVTEDNDMHFATGVAEKKGTKHWKVPWSESAAVRSRVTIETWDHMVKYKDLTHRTATTGRIDLRKVTVLQPATLSDASAPTDAIDLRFARHQLVLRFETARDREASLRLWVNAVPEGAVPRDAWTHLRKVDLRTHLQSTKHKDSDLEDEHDDECNDDLEDMLHEVSVNDDDSGPRDALGGEVEGGGSLDSPGTGTGNSPSDPAAQQHEGAGLDRAAYVLPGHAHHAPGRVSRIPEESLRHTMRKSQRNVSLLHAATPLPVASNDKIVLTGKLLKKGIVRTNYLSRHFRLHASGKLEYYVDDDATSPKGQIPLAHCRLHLEESTSINPLRRRRAAWRLTITLDDALVESNKSSSKSTNVLSPARTLYKIAGEKAELEHWVAHLTDLRLAAAWHLPSSLVVPPLAVDCDQLAEAIAVAQADAVDERLVEPAIAHLAHARSTQQLAQRGDACSFYCVRAADLRDATSLVTLPPFQELRETRPGWLVELPVNAPFAAQQAEGVGVREERLLAVSHRWEERLQPDPNGSQLRAIQEVLREHPEVELVWYDWCCLPQGKRSPDDDRIFRAMLRNVNLMYLSASCLLLVDMMYGTRFWTNFEAWLSFQSPSTHFGLAPADPSQRKVTVRKMYGMTDLMLDAIVSRWDAWATPELAVRDLSQPDCVVTNNGDKQVQLEKLKDLRNEFRGRAMRASESTATYSSHGTGSATSGKAAHAASPDALSAASSAADVAGAASGVVRADEEAPAMPTVE